MVFPGATLPAAYRSLPAAYRCLQVGPFGRAGGAPIALDEDVVTLFSTFATNLVHAMSEIYRDICLQMQRHSRHVVIFAYRRYYPSARRLVSTRAGMPPNNIMLATP